MARSTWQELPATVRAAIERQAGAIDRVEIPTAGRNSDFSATLHLHDGGRVFCKGIATAEDKRGRMHRHEASINPWLPSAVAPRLRWSTETDGWLVLGFDHVRGRHADLGPASPDLPVLTQTITIMGHELAECPAVAPRIADQWATLAPWRRLAADIPPTLDPWAVEHLDDLITWEHRAIADADGDGLIHTDLHALNIMVSDNNAQIVDWAWSRKGAPAIDAAILTARLIDAGHSPALAHQWAATLPIWQTTPTTTRTALTIAVWGIWEYLRHTESRPVLDEVARAAQASARYLLT